jgi:ankyrin repeat protein
MATREFLEAVKRGDLEHVVAALRGDPSLAHLRDEDGVSVVCLSLYHGHASIAARLAVQRPDLDVFEAASFGDALRVARLIDLDPGLVDALSPDGFRPLGLACFFGRIEVFELLVARGADLVSPSQNAMRVCPLHSAVAHRDAAVALALARRLLALGAPPSPRQQRGFTPLHEAALRGHAELVALLLEHGAERDARNDEGRTPLELAREHAHHLASRLLADR